MSQSSVVQSLSLAPSTDPGPHNEPMSVPVGAPVTDVLGEPYTARTLHLANSLDATLVHLPGPAGATRGVLYVHGFADYFFQTELAEFHHRRGEHFYAVDLHRYGRSLRDGQIPYDMSAVDEYFDELDLAREVIVADGCTSIVVAAHSTGGLITPLWLSARGTDNIAAMVLNSPFLELPVSPVLRSVLTPAIDFLAGPTPHRAFPLPDTGFYGRSLHTSLDGEWEFDTTWKPLKGNPVRVGWLSAVRKGQNRIVRGLHLPIPILVLSSDKSFRSRTWSDAIHVGDAVLDADRIAALSTRLGDYVTYARITDAKHDILLSRAPVRDHAYQVIDHWLTAELDH